jgi:hypothetical protein
MRVRVAHASMQFGDSDHEHTADAEKLFDRAVDRKIAWITGTESGPGSGNLGEELLRVGKAHGYRMWVPEVTAGPREKGGNTDCWIGVREDLISGNFDHGYREAIPGSTQLYSANGHEPDGFPRWGPKGLVTVAFDCEKLQGRVNIGAAHYLTGARSPNSPVIKGVDHWEWNEKLAKVIAEWANEVGKGHDLAFYAGDQNMADSKNDQPQGDTFMGGPMTSLADELKKWQNTGHGPIDVIASYNRDSRVSGLDFEVFDDKEFFLNTDHFYLEGVFKVEPLKR